MTLVFKCRVGKAIQSSAHCKQSSPLVEPIGGLIMLQAVFQFGPDARRGGDKREGGGGVSCGMAWQWQGMLTETFCV